MKFARLSAVIGAALLLSTASEVLGDAAGHSLAHRRTMAVRVTASDTGNRPSPAATTAGAAAQDRDESVLNPSAYPWPRLRPSASLADAHGYFAGECTSFAAWAIRHDGLRHEKSPDFLGDATQWTGAAIDPEPHVGDIAQWAPWRSRSRGRGHVAYVAAVGVYGSIKIYEYNWGALHRLTVAWIPASTVTRFLRF